MCRGAPIRQGSGQGSIHQLQVTARSYLGALVLQCGGLLVDDGWLRVFGSPVGGAAPESPTLWVFSFSALGAAEARRQGPGCTGVVARAGECSSFRWNSSAISVSPTARQRRISDTPSSDTGTWQSGRESEEGRTRRVRGIGCGARGISPRRRGPDGDRRLLRPNAEVDPPRLSSGHGFLKRMEMLARSQRCA
ncbi:DUF2625 family protein [Streptomyces sp. NPDC021056]|uniref:DUF2625 family protein n=1 Tax=Streptomyces sp. NPDC021056 TaxID=3155012 RepID=UPI0033F27632